MFFGCLQIIGKVFSYLEQKSCYRASIWENFILWLQKMSEAYHVKFRKNLSSMVLQCCQNKGSYAVVCGRIDEPTILSP
jgi:hypothetical protein